MTNEIKQWGDRVATFDRPNKPWRATVDDAKNAEIAELREFYHRYKSNIDELMYLRSRLESLSE